MKNSAIIFDLIILAVISVFILMNVYPQGILLTTTPTGGDYGSHYYTAHYLKNYLIPHGKISGWNPGNYAGSPFFQFYPPFPFILMAAASYLIPLQIAFKIVSFLGVIFLPFASYASLRLMGFKNHAPIISSILILLFLFSADNYAFGGNIKSVLSGEFCYSISLLFLVLFAGFLYNGIKSGRFIVLNSVLLFLIGVSHPMPLMAAVFIPLFFLYQKNLRKSAYYILKMYLLSFMMLAFWAVPFIAKMIFATPWSYSWTISILWELFPRSLLPVFLLFAAVSLFYLLKAGKFSSRMPYLIFSAGASLILFFIAPHIGAVDIRFMPIFYLFVILAVSAGVSEILKNRRSANIIIIIALVTVLVCINSFFSSGVVNYSRDNFQGFENKPLWDTFKNVNDFLNGTVSDSRVVFEHSAIHNSAGTSRAFESLPLFSGRSTLEGLYIESALSSPFIFYIQSEISKTPTAPFTKDGYRYSQFNLTSAIEHLKLFNVGWIIAAEESTKTALEKHAGFELMANFKPYKIFKVNGDTGNNDNIGNNNDNTNNANDGKYVTPLSHKPVIIETSMQKWKKLSYDWFVNYSGTEPFLVFSEDIGVKEEERFIVSPIASLHETLPMQKYTGTCYVNETVLEEEILINTNCINRPLLVKISYYPNWKVEGADKIYLASPSFMLIYPEQENVRLYYDGTELDAIAMILSFFGFLFAILTFFHKRFFERINSYFCHAAKFLDKFELSFNAREKINKYMIAGIILVIALLVIAVPLPPLNDFFSYNPEYGSVQGAELVNHGKYGEAKELLGNKEQLSAEERYLLAFSYFSTKNDTEALSEFNMYLEKYPDGLRVPEIYYYRMLCYLHLVDIDSFNKEAGILLEKYPDSTWADYAVNVIREHDKL